VLESLLDYKPLGKVQLEEVLDDAQCFFRGSREHVSQLLLLYGGKTVKHGLGERAVN